MSGVVGIAIPSIPTRPHLPRAIASVTAQTRKVDAITVAVDNGREGAWTTRNRALRALLTMGTEWVGFLDDDDELLPHHVEYLLDAAHDRGAGLVWGWFTVAGGVDPFPGHRGRPYDPACPHVVPITYLVRRTVLAAAVERCGGFHPDEHGNWGLQDQPLFDAMHVVLERDGLTSWADPEITWVWHHHGKNTSGLPSRW